MQTATIKAAAVAAVVHKPSHQHNKRASLSIDDILNATCRDSGELGELGEFCGSADEGHHTSSSYLSLDLLSQNLSREQIIGLTCATECEKVVNETKETASSVFDNLEKRDCLAPFGLDEIELSKNILGHGEFSDVYEVIAFKLKPPCEKTSDLTLDEKKARKFLTKNSTREKTNVKRYAIKHLRPKLMDDPEKFITAARDLVLEAQLLACIDHPNIIKIRGCAIDGPEGYESGLNTGYFLVLDRLQGTLHDRISSWKKKQKKRSSWLVTKLLDRKGRKQEKFWLERLKICFDLAGALFYLHEHGIIFRDLKPQNIGFDIRGDVKLFDFGLAKFLPTDGSNSVETYKLSGAGTLRYMAPEVAKREEYNLKADVYGFALVCWAVLKMDIPFRAYHNVMLLDGVIDGGANGDRPALDSEWPDEIKKMMEKGWSYDQRKRPTMKYCYKTLRSQLSDNGVERDSLKHDRRRSSSLMGSDRRILSSKRGIFSSMWNVDDSCDLNNGSGDLTMKDIKDRRSLMASLKSNEKKGSECTK